MFEILSTIQLADEYASAYLIYTRKSTDDAENQKNSIDYQVAEGLKMSRRELLEIAPFSREGFCNGGVIREHHSGFEQDGSFTILPDGSVNQKVARPKFLILAELLKQKKFKGVIILCWDRASRNESDDIILKKLMGLGVDIRFVQTTYDKSSSGALHMDIDGAFSRHYSRVIGEKVRDTTRKLRAEGRCTYRSPIGYHDNGSDSKPFDPERAPIVKRIFELYATGEWSFQSLAKWADRQGLTSKPFRRHRTKEEKMGEVEIDTVPKTCRKVSEKTIENILNNPFYIGKIIHGSEWLDSTAHQALIDAGLFFKVQAIMKQKTVSIYYPELSFFTYRGLINCAVCGRAYSPYVQKGMTYYSCKCKEGCINKLKNVNDTFLNKQIQKVLDKIYLTDAELKDIEVLAREELNKVTERRNKELDDLYRQLNKAMADMDYLAREKLSLLRVGAMTFEQVKDEEIRLTILIEKIQTEINANAESSRAMLDYIITFSKLIKNAASYFEFALDTEKRDLITKVFSELSFKDGELKYQAKQGYSCLLARFDSNYAPLGAPNYVLSELPQICLFVKSSMTSLKEVMVHHHALKSN